MKYVNKLIHNDDGTSDVLIAIKLDQEDWKGLKKIAPEQEVFPENYDSMDLDQILCWVRIMAHYTELWQDRNEDHVKKIIKNLIKYKESNRRQKRKISSRRKKVKRITRKKLKRDSRF